MKRNIRKTAILLSAVILGEVLCQQGSGDIRMVQTCSLVGSGSQTVYGAELFVDGTERTGTEQSVETDRKSVV